MAVVVVESAIPPRAANLKKRVSEWRRETETEKRRERMRERKREKERERKRERKR